MNVCSENENNKHILVTGANGQLAYALRHTFNQHPLPRAWQAHFYAHEVLDITQYDVLENYFKKNKPHIVINTAAYTAVDQAEENQGTAMAVNYLGAQNLAKLCQRYQSLLMHISTDYVFSGSSHIPYQEHDEAQPINQYGLSKWRGEQAIREHCQQHLILRVSGIYSHYGHNFLKTILRLAKQRAQLTIVADQVTSPTSANDIAELLFKMLQVTELKPFGTYHFASQEQMSWHAFALAIIEEAKKTNRLAVTEIKAITSSAYPSPAKRPAYSVLNCEKIKKVFGFSQPSIYSTLQQIIGSYFDHGALST